MRFTVSAFIMCTIGALLSIILGVQPVIAACTNDSQCDSDHLCMDRGGPRPWGGIAGPPPKECTVFTCSADSTCAGDPPSCRGGICRGINPSSRTGGGGVGIPQSGVGQKCGQVKIGQVTKSVGCKPPLQCIKVPASSSSGTCREPLK